jgi:uncharacterized ion transporter superfamily protein YfcC
MSPHDTTTAEPRDRIDDASRLAPPPPRDPAHRLTPRTPHALVMMLLVIAAAIGLTYLVPSGAFERTKAGLVVPGTFHVVPKDFAGGLRGNKGSPTLAAPASPIALVTAIPAGMVRQAALIFLILFVGGMFGVLQQTGALEAGITRLLAVTRGNVFIVAPVVMLLLAGGSTFLGLISEYLVLIPIAVLLAERMGYDALFGTAMVTIAAKIGYLTSVTNPLALAIAQPIVGVPVFSGAAFRAATFLVFLPIGIWFLLRSARRGTPIVAVAADAPAMTMRHIAGLFVLLAAIVVMVVGVQEFDWGNAELSAMYLAVALILAVVGGLTSRDAAQAFLRGMQGMMLAGILVGLAAAVEVVLREGAVLDTVVAFLARSVEGKPPMVVASLMMGAQMLIDVFIPSTSGQAAVTMPILGPIGQLAGVSGQVTVQAFLFGNGMMNAITPTSGMLLAYLAAGGVSYGRWIRYVLPLVLLLTGLAIAALLIAVMIGI